MQRRSRAVGGIGNFSPPLAILALREIVDPKTFPERAVENTVSSIPNYRNHPSFIGSWFR
jgi:hypothetical protein